MRLMGIEALYRKKKGHQDATPRIRSILIFLETSSSIARIKSGAPIFRTSRCGAAFSTSSQSWIGGRGEVLTWRLSNSLTTDFCIDAVEAAIAMYGCPEIFNTDQGCQFTALAFVEMLKGYGIAISMDGRGAWRDNVFVERFWRSAEV